MAVSLPSRLCTLTRCVLHAIRSKFQVSARGTHVYNRSFLQKHIQFHRTSYNRSPLVQSARNSSNSESPAETEAQNKLSWAKHKLASLFDEDDMAVILKTLNSSSELELCRFSRITKERAKRLIKHREENGDFKSLSDLLTIQGFALQSLSRIASDIINVNHGPTSDRTGTRHGYVLNRTHVVPKYTSSQLPESVVSYDLHLEGLAWVHFTRDMRVEDWGFMPMPDKLFIKYDHVLYMQTLQDMINKLPTPELYLTEESAYRPRQITRVHVNRARLESMFAVMLNMKSVEKEDTEAVVYILRPQVTGRFFSLMVGGERVSCQDVVRRISTDFHISPDILETYKQEIETIREQMANSLLQSVAFYRLLNR